MEAELPDGEPAALPWIDDDDVIDDLLSDTLRPLPRPEAAEMNLRAEDVESRDTASTD